MNAPPVAVLRQAAVVLALGTTALHAQQHVWSGSSVGLIERAPVTLDLIRIVDPIYINGFGAVWTSDGDWIWTTTNQSGPQPASLWRANLGDGALERISLSGPTLIAGRYIAFDPATNKLRAFYGADWYTVDRSTGAVNFEKTVTGFSWPVHEPAATFFAPGGDAYVISYYNSTGNGVYRVPPGSTSALYLGEVEFGDVATMDTPWCASYEGANNALVSYYKIVTNSPGGGLARLNLSTLSVTELETWSGVLGGASRFVIAPPTQQTTYCTARTNSLGCAPVIGSVGYASASASRGFVVRATEVINNSNGMLVWSLSARAALPFHGATLCVAPPIYRTPVLNSGHKITVPVACQAVWERDLNQWWHDTVPLPAGVTVRCQWYGRDPGYSAPNDAQTSNALEFVLRP